MKHAGPDTLRRLAPLLEGLRALPGLVERKPGTFYIRSTAFLHFHEDPAGVFVDVKFDGPTFRRLALHTAAERASLLAAVPPAVERFTASRRAA